MTEDDQHQIEDSTPLVTVTLRVVDKTTGMPHDYDHIPLKMYVSLYQAVYKLAAKDGKDGSEKAFDLMLLGAAVLAPERISNKDAYHLSVLARASNKYKEHEHWSDDADPVLSACYHLLLARQITRKQAADIAAQILNETINPETWTDTFRIRVDRWAARRELDPVNVARGGARKKQTNR